MQLLVNFFNMREKSDPAFFTFLGGSYIQFFLGLTTLGQKFKIDILLSPKWLFFEL